MGAAGQGIGLRSAAALLCACAALVGAARAEAAAPVTIAGPGAGGGKVDSPRGVAVDAARGFLYVADGNNFRIDKFDTEGEFLLAWGWGVADGTSQELQVCGPESGNEIPRCFKASSTTASGPGAVVPEAVAVEPSSGDVYVSDGFNHRVTKFGPDGELLFMVGRNVNKTKVDEEGPGAPYSQEEKNICTAADLEAGEQCGAGLSGAGPGEFESPRALALDSAENLWVGDEGRLAQLDPSGSYLTQAPLPGAGQTKGLAIDSANGDFYLVSEGLDGVRRYAPVGSPVEALSEVPPPIDPAPGSAEAVALDGAGDLYVGDSTAPYRFKKYDGESGEQLAQFGAGQVIGAPGANQVGGGNPLAIDNASGALYAANSAVQRFEPPPPGPLVEGLRAEGLLPTEATLAATINPEGETTEYRFAYVTEAGYQADKAEGGDGFEGPGATFTPASPATLPGSGFEEEEVSANLEGLVPETTYRFRLLASNVDGQAREEAAFATRPTVGIEAQWASAVAARSARLNAELDPLGPEARWRVQYGTSPCSAGGCAESAEAVLPAGFGARRVGVLLSGLEPATTYHYRFVASDVREVKEGGETVQRPFTAHGEDRAFTTPLAGLGFEPIDGRAWEMLTPQNKFGAVVGFNFQGEGHVQAAADGEALAFLSLGSIEAGPEGNRAPEDSSVLARRAGPGEWRSKDITPPHTVVTSSAVGEGREYKLFSADLERALLEPRDPTPLSPYASERTPYLRHNTEPPTYIPLVIGCPAPPAPCPPEIAERANVPDGTQFGGSPRSNQGEVRVRGATPDLERVVLQSLVALAPGAAPNSLYAWSRDGWEEGRDLELLSRDEGGAVLTARFGSGAASTRHAISAGGERAFWSKGIEAPFDGLYLRDSARDQTLRLDSLQGGFGTGGTAPVFQGADPSGSVALFTDSHQLTAEANEAGRDLYRCEIGVEGGALKCALSDLTADPGESAEVQGLLPGMSEDADRAYFVARGALDAEPNEFGDSAAPGEPNLYAWQEGAGVRFIATLAEADDRVWGSTAPKQSAAASPSGRYLAFMSERPLTGYDNRDASSGERVQEVYRYDALANAGEGGLICASCNPAGARPAGLPGGVAGQAPDIDPQGLWSGRALAAVLPEATRTSLPKEGGASIYRPRAIHDNGRLFFNAADALVPADSNNEWDVYLHEPTGTGGCSAGSGGAAVARSAGGCVGLVSSGTAGGESAFIDSSVGGNDAFFLSPGRLSASDSDAVTDVYDARVGGTAARIEPLAECLGEACQPATSPPEFGPPASAAFQGPGNPRAGARGRCNRAARAAKRISRRAKRARRAARRADAPRRTRQMKRRSRRLAGRAKRNSKRAKRCRARARRAKR